MISEKDAFENWKGIEFEKRLFNDVYAKNRQQLVMDTMTGVRHVAPVSSQGMFGSKKPASELPRVDGKNKFTP